jgi:AraC-like DNA-binding protein
VDVLTSLLDGPRARGAFLIRAVMAPPWCIRVEDEAPLTLLAMRRGEARIVSDAPHAGPPATLHPGDLALVRGPHPCTMGDDLATPPHALIRPGPACVTPAGVAKRHAMAWFGVRTWGNRAEGPTEFLVCTYRVQGEISQRLLDALPPLLTLPGGVDAPIAPLLADEAVKERPGQSVVLDRLIDILLIAALRTWFARLDGDAPRWYTALGDPVVGRALRLLHDRPERPWTVASLARDVGVSRAVLARRFTAMTGESPMAYLTSWRLSLAADLLTQPNLTIADAAQRVGYGSAFALSTAFKRERGLSPQQHREKQEGPPL